MRKPTLSTQEQKDSVYLYSIPVSHRQGAILTSRGFLFLDKANIFFHFSHRMAESHPIEENGGDAWNTVTEQPSSYTRDDSSPNGNW